MVFQQDAQRCVASMGQCILQCNLAHGRWVDAFIFQQVGYNRCVIVDNRTSQRVVFQCSRVYTCILKQPLHYLTVARLTGGSECEIARRCNLELEMGRSKLPLFPTPEKVSLDDYLLQQAQAGLVSRLQHLYPDAGARSDAAHDRDLPACFVNGAVSV